MASHPVQYQAPWYRALAKIADLWVFFSHRVTADEQGAAGFGVAFDWDVPLLDGYEHEWLPNVAARPAVDRFRGCDTPSIADRLTAGRFDAVVVNGWQLLSYWQAVRAANHQRIPVFVRGDSHLSTERRAATRVAKRVAYPRLLRAFDGYLAVGQRNRDYYRHYGVPDDRIWPAPHCVDNVFFARSAAAARAADMSPRRLFGIADNAAVFLLAAKLIEMKRPLDFIQALAAARSAGASVRGLVAGDGPLRAEMEAHARRAGVPCTFAGFLNQQQIGAAYAAADALVLPSDGRETWGLVVNEAMASGLPAIVSEAAGCVPDLVVDGRTGFAFPRGDVATLTRRMIETADRSYAAALGRAAAAHIDAYSPAAAAQGVVAAVEGTRALQARARKRHHDHAIA